MPNLNQQKPRKTPLPKNVITTPLDMVESRALAAGQLAEMAREFQNAGIDLAAVLQGVSVIDVLGDGLGGQSNSPTVGQLPTPESTVPHGNDAGTVDQLLHPGSSSTDYGAPLRGMRGGFVNEGTGKDEPDKQPPTPVSGTSGGEIEENRVSTHTTLSDGTVVNKSVYSTSSGDYVSTSTASPDGESKTVTVIVDTAGHSAVIVDTRGTDGSTQSHASGDMDVIYSEFEHRLHVGGGGIDRYDPDYEGARDPFFHPVIDQGWRPHKPGNPTQVDPSRDGDSTGSSVGPQIRFDHNVLSGDPNPVADQVKGRPNPQAIVTGNPNKVDPPRPSTL